MSRRPALDPVFDAPIAAGIAAFAPSVTPGRISSFRARQDAIAFGDDAIRQNGAFTVQERIVERDGTALPMLICRPRTAPPRAPVLVHIHGGGMIGGSARNALRLPLELGLTLGMVVASIEYRLPPEHPHPTPLHDCLAGLHSVLDGAADLGLDPDRLILGGASAGGGLAASVAFALRANGGPTPHALWLRCPMLDDRELTPSSTEIEGEIGWDVISNRTGWAALLSGVEVIDELAVPARATDLSGLPPTFIEIGSVDLFRDESIDFAARIWRAGGSAELHVWSGGHHGFEDAAPTAAVTLAAREARIDWFRRQLG